MDTISTEHIEKTPTVCDGDPVISGHHLRVMDIVVMHEMQGNTSEEIAGMFAITLAEVHAALAYYFDHREEIDAEFRRDDKALKRILGRYASKVRTKTAE